MTRRLMEKTDVDQKSRGKQERAPGEQRILLGLLAFGIYFPSVFLRLLAFGIQFLFVLSFFFFRETGLHVVLDLLGLPQVGWGCKGLLGLLGSVGLLLAGLGLFGLIWFCWAYLDLVDSVLGFDGLASCPLCILYILRPEEAQ